MIFERNKDCKCLRTAGSSCLATPSSSIGTDSYAIGATFDRGIDHLDYGFHRSAYTKSGARARVYLRQPFEFTSHA